MTPPLAIDLYCGLGGWAEGFLSEGYRVVGFDIERHDYGTGGYPGFLVLQDVLTLCGSQFKDAAVIVASPPCQAYSYRAMPWRRAKALPPPDNTLFEACFRIQREASEAAGRYIPLIVENVRGAQKWVGRAKANFGSYYLWGDVGMVGKRIVAGPLRFGVSVAPVKATKNNGGSWFAVAHNTTSGHGQNPDGRKLSGNNAPRRWADREVKRLCDAPISETGFKSQGMNWSDRSKRGQDFTRVAGHQAMGRKQSMGGSWYGDYENFKSKVGEHVKQGGDWLGRECQSSMSRLYSSKDPRRKAASAQIAKIPFPLSQHIARCFRPGNALSLGHEGSDLRAGVDAREAGKAGS